MTPKPTDVSANRRLDGVKVNDFVDDSGQVEPLCQVITGDERSGDVILKVVNAQATRVRTRVDLDGPPLSSEGRVTTMTAASLSDMNTFAEPTRVVPRTRSVSGLGRDLTYDFPAHSITFIRLDRAS